MFSVMSINQLNYREKLVLETRSGVSDRSRKTQRNIAETLDISRSYVSRIEKRAIYKMSNFLLSEDTL